MRKIIMFFKLPFGEKWMMMEAFLLLGFSRFIIVSFPFKKIAGILGKENRETEQSNEGIRTDKVYQVSRSVRTMAKYTPWESKCLAQAYAARIMLSSRKQPCTVYLGVAKDENNQMIAHAWVRCGTAYVTGGNGCRYTITGKFS